MTRLAWCTDLHLDTCTNSEYLIESISKKAIDANVDGLMISGDISTSKKLVYHLSVLEKTLQKPIYFVLGNEEGIIVYSTTYVQTGKINIDQSNINIQQEEIQVQDGSQICNPGEDGDLTCTINGNQYTFKLNQGENFYFVIQAETEIE